MECSLCMHESTKVQKPSHLQCDLASGSVMTYPDPEVQLHNTANVA